MSKSALVDVGQFATFYDSFMYFSDKLAKFPRDYFLAHRVYIDWQRYLKSKLYGVQLNELQQNSNTMVITSLLVTTDGRVGLLFLEARRAGLSVWGPPVP